MFELILSNDIHHRLRIKYLYELFYLLIQLKHSSRMHSSILFTCNLLLLFSVTAADWSSDQDPEKWNQAARNAIDSLLNKKLNKNIAKNLIMFLGDGMGVRLDEI